MSTRTSQRRLAIQQRRTLKDRGYTDREIQAFAQLFKTQPTDDPDHRYVCAADKEPDR
jgi:hypothetical protein